MTKEEIRIVAAGMGHTLPTNEVAAIEFVTVHGERHGFGNLMAWLATAWALSLHRGYGIPLEDAQKMTHGTPYSIPTELDATNPVE